MQTLTKIVIFSTKLMHHNIGFSLSLLLLKIKTSETFSDQEKSLLG